MLKKQILMGPYKSALFEAQNLLLRLVARGLGLVDWGSCIVAAAMHEPQYTTDYGSAAIHENIRDLEDCGSSWIAAAAIHDWIG